MLSKRKYLFGTTMMVGLMAVAAPAFAQTAQQVPPTQDDRVDDVNVDEEAVVEEIVVTGSRIRRDPVNSPAPIIQVQGEQLLETGLPTIIDYLATIPALSNSLVPSDTTGSLNIAGLSAANLRTLGTNRVLTLIDGRRQVGSQVGQLVVDVDTVPRLLIQNVEIITGGASSVYGADAVAGVVNYILRKDYEGLQIDANVGQLAEGGGSDPLTRRVSILAGKNFFDDRLNIYAFGEYEKLDSILRSDVDWLEDGRFFAIGLDSDPTSAAIGPSTDGVIDNGLFFGLRRLDRPRWGTTTIANAQQPSPLIDPDVPLGNCTGLTSANCFSVDPRYTYWYQDGQARLANFGTRVGNTGLNRPFNIGGDGDNPNTFFPGIVLTPESESQRFQVGANFKLTDNVTAYVEGKYVNEDSFIATQPSFFDVYISNTYSANAVQPLLSSSAFTTRLDNPFFPAVIRNALTNNLVPTYTQNRDTPGTVTGSTVRNFARHQAFGVDRTQENNRELQRYVASLRGEYDRVGFIDNFTWDVAYTYGRMNNFNRETGMNILNTAFALDAVTDNAGVVNGRPGEVVCRVRLLAAQGLTIANPNPLTNDVSAGGSATLSPNDPAVAGCVPLNVFGAGNQSAEGIAYTTAAIFLDEQNTQNNAVASVSGQLWDLWGAGPMGFALGYEYRKEEAEGLGRSASTANRYLQLNTGGDFLPSEYDSNEAFAELSLPLLADSWLGEFAELSATYRAFDYSTAGSGDVYGVSLVYRPIQDITFKTSYNTSFRAPLLSETNSPLTQTFANGFVDPCDTRQITSANRTAEERANRIANCTALAAQRGLTYDFAGSTASATDDFLPTYSSGIAGVNGGNPLLEPETSSSFTFSTVLQPRFIPNFSIILDYYEIEIDSVIQSVTAQTLANQCVDGPGLDAFSCDLIFRENPNTGDAFDVFKVGRPSGDPVGGFIQVPVNYASREVKGLDFDVAYRFDTEEMIGRNWGQFNWTLGGSWLIEQKNYTSFSQPDFFTALEGGLFYPRVRMTQALTWIPTERLAITWRTDWQTSQDLLAYRDYVAGGNTDNRPEDSFRTGNFARNDISVRYDVTEDVTLRAGVTNVLDEEQNPYLGNTIYSNFDSYGRRYNVGLNVRLW